MGEKRFRILFRGEIAEGRDQQKVKRALSSRFKLSPEILDEFFSGKREIVAGNLDSARVQQYQAAFRQTGALLHCRTRAGSTAIPCTATGAA